MIIPHHDTVIREDDHVIVFCTNKEAGAEGREVVPGRVPLPLTCRPTPAPARTTLRSTPLGLIIMIFGLLMKLPLIVSAALGDGATLATTRACSFTFVAGPLLCGGDAASGVIAGA